MPSSLLPPAEAGPERTPPIHSGPTPQATKSPQPGVRSSGPLQRRAGWFTAAGGKWPGWPWNLRSPRAGGSGGRCAAGRGQLPKLPQSPQPLHELFIGDLARRVHGRNQAETALAGQQVVLAAFVHGGEDTTEPITPCHYLSLAFRMCPLSPFAGPELGSSEGLVV